MAEQHPHLIEIVHHPDVAILECRIESMQLLNGPVEQHIHQVGSSTDPAPSPDSAVAITDEAHS